MTIVDHDAAVRQFEDGASSTSPPPSGAAPQVELTPSGIQRIVVARSASAHCLTCGDTWSHPYALALGTHHARRHGHEVEGSYSATYRYARARSR